MFVSVAYCLHYLIIASVVYLFVVVDVCVGVAK